MAVAAWRCGENERAREPPTSNQPDFGARVVRQRVVASAVLCRGLRLNSALRRGSAGWLMDAIARLAGHTSKWVSQPTDNDSSALLPSGGGSMVGAGATTHTYSGATRRGVAVWPYKTSRTCARPSLGARRGRVGRGGSARVARRAMEGSGWIALAEGDTAFARLIPKPQCKPL
jgi:hypothetical protein